MTDQQKLGIAKTIEDAVWGLYDGNKMNVNTAEINLNLECIERCRRLQADIKAEQAA